MTNLISINNSFESYQKLISFYQEIKDKFFDDVHLSLSHFFAANMSAALGAILNQFSDNINDIHFDYMSSSIEAILQKNDFLAYYGKS
jgi:hypothetical protein